MPRGRIVLAVLAAIGGVVLLLDLLPDAFRDSDRASGETLAVGRSVYLTHCASCHGANLEGQPDWQTPLRSGRLPAPPHDPSGHTWHHSDRMLFDITKYGTAAVVGRGYESDMPGFESVLSDDHIRGVLAFIKSTWPAQERRYQREMSDRDAAERRANREADSSRSR